MHNKFESLIKYYRNSLADGERMDIPVKECKNGFIVGNIFDLSKEELTPVYNSLHQSIFRRNKKENKKEEKNPIDIFLAPFSLSANHVHGVKKTNTQSVYPFWLAAKVTPEGELIITQGQVKIPWFVRSVLEPVCFDTNYFPVISSVTNVDNKLDTTLFDVDTWEQYIKISNDFFTSVTGVNIQDYDLDGFLTNHSTCIIQAKKIVSATGILRLYEDVPKIKKTPVLLNKIINLKSPERKPLPENEELFEESTHVGQYSSKFCLSTSQRKSLLAFEKNDSGEIIAVNGPPGTGKTTLLQSVVANQVVKAVGTLDSPPLILASSTNNQAITNILDNFGGQGGKIERWLPNLNSLGMYMISNDKKKQKEALKKGYQLLINSNNEFEGHYYQHFHEADIETLKSLFISKFNEMYNVTYRNIESITEWLESEVVNRKKKITAILDLLKQVKFIGKRYYKIKELPEKKKELENLSQNISKAEKHNSNLLSFKKNFELFMEKNKLLNLFSFIPFIRKIFSQKLELFVIGNNVNIESSCDVSIISDYLISELKSNKDLIEQLTSVLQSKLQIFNMVSEIGEQWKSETEYLAERWGEYYTTLDDDTLEKVDEEFDNVGVEDRLNRMLDISLRYEAFDLSIHYWEGKYLQFVENEKIKMNKGLPSKKQQFKLMSYLTPLFISTFHSAPNFASYRENTSDKWISKPIYELFDLLIVDEAGQVTPEVSIATFSLAKKSIVVGDIHQIEPVWSIPYEKVDKGNLLKYNVLKFHSFDELKTNGALCSSGNLMKLAQYASNYKTNEQLNGTLLTEHRRCVDELLDFSNIHVYDNLLEPKVGKLQSKHYGENQDFYLPALAYLHVNGISEQKSGSNFNKKEASLISQWIKKYQDTILQTINKDKQPQDYKQLKDILAVVTPFAAQKHTIYDCFEKFGISKDVTVGTVHALQGAEREIVIFSPVYGSNHNGALFFDMGFNMLNVAITRAKKHFIVIGNMSLFNSSNVGRPSGALATYLFSSSDNELSNSLLFDIPQIKEQSRISDLAVHVEKLNKAFRVAKRRVIVVSPFISIEAIISDNLISVLDEAVSREVEVIVYTDMYLDKVKGKLKSSSKKGRKALVDAGAKLVMLKGLHNKALAVDESVLIEGSFNWLSAVRDISSRFCRHDVSNIKDGEEARIQITQLIEEMNTLQKS